MDCSLKACWPFLWSHLGLLSIHLSLLSFKLITHQNNLKKILGFIWAVSQIWPQAVYLLVPKTLAGKWGARWHCGNDPTQSLVPSDPVWVPPVSKQACAVKQCVKISSSNLGKYRAIFQIMRQTYLLVKSQTCKFKGPYSILPERRKELEETWLRYS